MHLCGIWNADTRQRLIHCCCFLAFIVGKHDCGGIGLFCSGVAVLMNGCGGVERQLSCLGGVSDPTPLTMAAGTAVLVSTMFLV